MYKSTNLYTHEHMPAIARQHTRVLTPAYTGTHTRAHEHMLLGPHQDLLIQEPVTVCLRAYPGWRLCLLSDQPALLGVEQQVTMVTGQYANFCPVGSLCDLCHSMLAEWQSVNMMSRRLFGFLLGFCFAGADIAAGPS